MPMPQKKKRTWVSGAIALSLGVTLSASNGQTSQGPDLSGRWHRDAAASADTAGWGPQIEISRSGANVTIQPSPGKPSRFTLDGKETAEVMSVDGCRNTVRITKAETSRDKVTITTWLVTKSVCVHGEDEDDPMVTHIGVVDVEKVFGRRKLESITDVYREGDSLTVQTTRSSLGEVTTTTTTYRK
jgi:hypothetical protein